MSDTGGVSGVGDVDITFDDSAPQRLLGTPTTGSYLPTNINNSDADPFAAMPYCNPGPDEANPQANCLTQSFRGTNPNGTWKLYVVDQFAGDEGQLARGWSLDITTDIAPPETTIDSGPSGTITSASTSFAFSSSEAGSTFQCSVDGGAFITCASPLALSGLAEGGHAFAVSATDPTGNVDATPAIRNFTVSTAHGPASDRQRLRRGESRAGQGQRRAREGEEGAQEGQDDQEQDEGQESEGQGQEGQGQSQESSSGRRRRLLSPKISIKLSG